MNLPNKLTVLRILLMPLAFFLVFQNHWASFLSGYILSILIGFTDYFDGYLARRYGTVTRFGQFLDPLADKIFVITLLLYFMEVHQIPAWFIILILIREFAMTDLRTLTAQEKVNLHVDIFGKRKALFQYLLLFHLGYLRFLELIHSPLEGFFRIFAQGTLIFLLILVTFFTIFSMGNYLWKNQKYFLGLS
ncbi:MAG: CDP-diacylglycerol--glycerol-3-phosphate 3-phosphatidyltransferase [Chlamydiae bacterium]|nr:CDP-diacylglycerol--glycerol-3-phosphate 3-phosphatidyltransferase [Chlamydiota bacterium]MBI3276513.1 CDP-diacylglycerol--glycerol-3-phosphate 3-phosphatidyltransferase [Chlamydiota bacterium]